MPCGRRPIKPGKPIKFDIKPYCLHERVTFWNGQYFECYACGKIWNNDDDRPCFCGQNGDMLVMINLESLDLKVPLWVCKQCVEKGADWLDLYLDTIEKKYNIELEINIKFKIYEVLYGKKEK